MKRLIIISFLSVMTVYPVFAQRINAITASQGVTIGTGYQSEKEDFVGICVTGDTAYGGVAQSTFNFSQNFTQKQAEEELGFAVGGKARFGAYETSAAANFAKSSISTSYSISSIWISEYTFPSQKLINIKKTDIGSSAYEHQWNGTCGDLFVDEIGRGAKLFFSIRVDFSSLEAKESFSSQFNLSGPLASANLSLKNASKQFSQDAKITITAYQVGGDVSKLTGVFGYSDTSAFRFAKCSLGDFDQCSSLIETAITYASDTNHGFPSQLALNVQPGPAPLYYHLAKYSNAAIYPPNEYPFINTLIQMARDTLSQLFEIQLQLSLTAQRLLELDLPSQAKNALLTQQRIIETNLSKIVASSKVCYDTPEKSPDEVNNLKSKLLPVDQTAFRLPPLPTASFRIMTTNGGIWDRKVSVDTMNSLITENQVSHPRSLKDIVKNGDEASAMLYIESSSLTEAYLYFENIKLGTFQLKQGKVKFPVKAGPNFASIITSTTRTFPGWQDVNIATITDSLMRNGLPKAEGMFYVIVKDQFDRKVRFDIEYSKWDFKTTTDPGSLKEVINFSSYIDWWDKNSNGTNGTVRNSSTLLEKSPERIDVPFVISPDYRTIAIIQPNGNTPLITFLGKVRYNHIRPLDCRFPSFNDVDFNKGDFEQTPGGGVQYKTKLMPVIQLQYYIPDEGPNAVYGNPFYFDGKEGTPIPVPKYNKVLLLKARMDLNWVYMTGDGQLHIHQRPVDDKSLHISNHIKECDNQNPLKTVLIQ